MLVIFAMTLIVFIGINVIGNPIDVLISPEADQLERARIMQAYGLDQPLWQQYLLFVKGVAQGDFGKSYVYNDSALQVIFDRLPATLELAVAAVFLTVVVGIPLGLYTACAPRAFFLTSS